jgi:hypothetical protein
MAVLASFVFSFNNFINVEVQVRLDSHGFVTVELDHFATLLALRTVVGRD